MGSKSDLRRRSRAGLLARAGATLALLALTTAGCSIKGADNPNLILG
ncbi:MAG: hypothetical protein QOI03_775 [Solirubrobacteraceae bacterium]|nr:hypothetical protein [Solirubrobacteraceae bacterium]